jgi:Ca2+-binding RTX toxin-like protein
LPASEIDPGPLGYPNEYLVVDIALSDDGSGMLSLPARFQGGAFQAADGSVWVYGGASPGSASPNSANYANYIDIGSAAGNGVTVYETITGAGTTATCSHTFSDAANQVSVYTEDGTIDGVGITNPAVWIYGVGGDGDDIFIGGAGNDWFYGGSGFNIFYGSPGTDFLRATARCWSAAATRSSSAGTSTWTSAPAR